MTIMMEYPENRHSTIEMLRSVLDLSLEGAVLSDVRRKDQPIIYCNQTFLNMSGYEEEEVVGRNCRFLQRNDEQQSELDVLRAAIKAQRPCKVVLRNYRKNGDLFFNRLSISPIFNEEGELTHYMGIQESVSFKKPETMGFTVVKTLLSQIKAGAQIINDDAIGCGMRIKIPKLDESGMYQSRRIPSLAGPVELSSISNGQRLS